MDKKTNLDLQKKNKIMSKLNYSLLILLSILTYSCSDDDYGSNNNSGSNDSTLSYDLTQANGSAVSGIAEFEELDNGDVQLTLSLNNVDAEADHPAHIHYNSVSEGGGIQVDLNNVEGSSGKSVTVFNQDIEGNSLSFFNISNLNSHINVHLNPDNLEVIAQGNIGSNVSSSDDDDNNNGGGGY